MNECISTLIVQADGEPAGLVEAILHRHGVAVVNQASTCGEAMVDLLGKHPPHLVVTATTLEDGSWEHILALAREATLPIAVIVVSRSVDSTLYQRVIEEGAWDKVVPSFRQRDIEQIVMSALTDAILRRRDLAQLHAPRLRGLTA